MNVPSTPLINLASRPFRPERAQRATLTATCIALLLSLCVLTGLVVHERLQAADLRRAIDRQNALLNGSQQEQARFTSVLSRPENADVFAVNVFLNELIARRSVSWTHVLHDLGTVMPDNVQLVGMRLPQVPTEEAGGVNHLQLDLLLGTDRPAAIIDFLKRLQGSKLFGAAQMLAQQPPSQNEPLYKFRVRVAYEQKL